MSRVQQDAEKLLEEQRQRRLTTSRMNNGGLDSYPSTTSGRVSTPEGFRRPAVPSTVAPSTPVRAPVARVEPDSASTMGDDSLQHHRSFYMRQAANAYHRQHLESNSPFGIPANGPSATTPLPDHFPEEPINGGPTLPDRPHTVPMPEQLFASRVPAQPPPQSATFPGNVAADYDDAVLYSMKFSELRDESFDFDPNADTEMEHAASGSSLPPLADRLAAALEEGREEQENMLKQTLASDWAAIDDWFTSQFADLATARTKKREERRGIAREFEDIVANRFEALDAEREDLKEALRKMQTSGAQVLKVGTPVRKRTADD